MASIVLTKYGSGRTIYRNYNFEKLELSPEYQSSTVDINGLYFDVILPVIAILSYQSMNFILIDNKVYELNNNIKIQYYCEQSKDDKSWIKIYFDKKLLVEVNYKNNEEPFINPFDGFEDWEVVNFAYRLASDVNKVIRNPDIILFPSGE